MFQLLGIYFKPVTSPKLHRPARNEPATAPATPCIPYCFLITGRGRLFIITEPTRNQNADLNLRIEQEQKRIHQVPCKAAKASPGTPREDRLGANSVGFHEPLARRSDEKDCNASQVREGFNDSREVAAALFTRASQLSSEVTLDRMYAT